MSTKTNKTFMVMAKLKLDVSVEISATDLDDALLKAKELGVHDFVDIQGEFTDGDHEVYGVFRTGE